MRILITGGAGFIGSHTAKAVVEAGHNIVVFDDLSVGNRRIEAWCSLVIGSLCDVPLLRKVLRESHIDLVMHFAAHAYVTDSVANPAKYFENNVSNTVLLLNAMLAENVKQFVFSSTCATYGDPVFLPITENHQQNPVNPYGESKLIVERMLRWYGEAYGLRSVVLRYFNAAGADLAGELGEDHDPETHLIPLTILAALGRRSAINIYGTTYPTPDGTAVRDYIHVQDLAAAHLAGVKYLASGGSSVGVNLGTGKGNSVREIISAVERYGAKVPVRELGARAGDPAILIADASRAARILNWRPIHSDIGTIVGSAWRWHQKLDTLKKAASG